MLIVLTILCVLIVFLTHFVYELACECHQNTKDCQQNAKNLARLTEVLDRYFSKERSNA